MLSARPATERTANYTALLFWLASGLIWIWFSYLGLMSWGLYGLGAVVSLVNLLVSTQVGAWLYTEPAA